MDVEFLADSLFHKWKIELKNKNRSKQFITSNFDELIDSWKSSNIPREVAFDLMPLAVREHYPLRSIARAIYKKNKFKSNTSEEDFIKSWELMIEGEAFQVFYMYYPLEVQKKQVISYGSMSKQEHMRQMSYAETHPDVDIQKVLEKRNKILQDDINFDMSCVEVNLETL